jgi:hypothetical protein
LPPLISSVSHDESWFGSYVALLASSSVTAAWPLGSVSGARSQQPGPSLHVGADPAGAVHQRPK